MSSWNCNVCGCNELKEIIEFHSMQRVTSDCRPFRSGGRVACCPVCGAVQKCADDRWLKEISEIYSIYSPYHQAGGEEQIVFDPESGGTRKRSEVILKWIYQSIAPNSQGKALDVGCGNGATLRSFSEVLPDWDLYGHELGGGAKDALSRIPRFKHLFNGDLSAIKEKFDVISMVHSLEHFVDPYDTVKKISGLLTEGGWIFIEVCNVLENPFDLVVADHLMHFSPSTLSSLLSRSGFEVIYVSTGRVKKEISLLARKSGSPTGAPVLFDSSKGSVAKECRLAASYIAWLNGCAGKAAKEAANSGGCFGIFGTSIAATWLATQIKGMVSFFVDEDVNRTGKMYMDLPVFNVEQVPPGSVVYLALVPELAELIYTRLKKSECRFLLPPRID